MGCTIHNAIIVSASGVLNRADEARQVALEFGLQASEVITSPVNGIKTFFIAPDGSKEGWAESDDGDVKRAKFKDWLRDRFYEWVEVSYGTDQFGYYNRKACVIDENSYDEGDDDKGWRPS
jgi:hypothetical protein